MRPFGTGISAAVPGPGITRGGRTKGVRPRIPRLKNIPKAHPAVARHSQLRGCGGLLDIFNAPFSQVSASCYWFLSLAADGLA